LFLFLAELLNLRFGPGFNFFASDIFFTNTITEHAHNLYRMSSNLRSIAYDLHYCPGSKNYRRQHKMTFSPEVYIVALKKWMVYVLYIFNLYIYQNFFRKLKIMILAFHITLIIGIVYGVCRIGIKSVQQCTYILFSVNLLLVGVKYGQRTMQVCS
jgi:hypothetical protein